MRTASIARILPLRARKGRKVPKPDIMARLRKTWGSRMFSAAEVAKMRQAELKGEEG